MEAQRLLREAEVPMNLELLEPLEPLPVIDDDRVVAPLPSRARHDVSLATIGRHARALVALVLVDGHPRDGRPRDAGSVDGASGSANGTTVGRPTAATTAVPAATTQVGPNVWPNVWSTGPGGPTSPTFTRMLDVTPERLERLPRWWASAAQRGRVRLTRRLTLEKPRPLPGGGWRMRGSLRRALITPAARFELTLWPHLGRYTKLSLEPRRRVHAGRRWFRRGHQGLDRLARALASPP